MGISDIEERLYNFVSTLSNSSKELTDDVRNHACSLVGDVKQIITESYDTLGDKYDYADATIRNTLDKIQDAVSEEDLVVIMNLLIQSISKIIRDVLRGSTS